MEISCSRKTMQHGVQFKGMFEVMIGIIKNKGTYMRDR